MSRQSTVVMWIVVVLLAAVYIFPLWEIRLLAAQYPQGLGIDIWVHKITGAQPHDLQNINGLNHYIGMKVIEPGAIPELRFMKWILAGLIALAAVVALVRKKSLMIAWVLLAIVLSIAGMYDFYKWEYSYGHELDPNAPIKIPGMSYQPPLFGTRQLLNFTTTAWPGLGGICAMLAVALAALALLRELVPPKKRRKRAHRVSTAVTVGALAVLALPSCSSGPEPIEYGVDACAYCLMLISDDRYGAEIRTTRGRAYKYDSIECMVATVAEADDVSAQDVAHYYTTDFAARGKLVDATSAAYLNSPALPSPMGMNLTSFSTRAGAEGARDKYGGVVLDWAQAQALVKERERR